MTTFTITTGSGKPVLGLRETPMLVLGTLSGMGLGSQIAELDGDLGGIISAEIQERGFQGELGKYFTVELERPGIPQNILVLGLGSPEKFDRKAITRAIKIAVARAVKLGCNKLTIPILPNRQTQGKLNLRGQAYIIREAVEQKLKDLKAEGALEVEFLCSPQAKVHLVRGLACKRMNDKGECSYSED
ncbi:MAG: hypothetical protein LCH63_20600 [Candidatus Melainabacteria bacterium]|jgi:hypothetical protein|nr:hypothetical protein [Candidatus Melainabacteria bacterium]OPZ88845.1 MAG: hypothetical protein BWY75_01416 [bacterium ADurb.Bin425]